MHRWYDPGTGRWISEDPIGFAAGDANLYRYVGNAPSLVRDPAGLQGEFVVHWHHLLPQEIFTAKFLSKYGLKIDINDTAYGWMLFAKDHVFSGGVHAPCDSVEWNAMWKTRLKNGSGVE